MCHRTKRLSIIDELGLRKPLPVNIRRYTDDNLSYLTNKFFSHVEKQNQNIVKNKANIFDAIFYYLAYITKLYSILDR